VGLRTYLDTMAERKASPVSSSERIQLHWPSSLDSHVRRHIEIWVGADLSCCT